MNFIQRIALKAFDIIFPNIIYSTNFPNSKRNYSGNTDKMRSNVVMAPLQWGMRQIIESPIRIYREGEEMQGHRAYRLLSEPNPYYSGMMLVAVSLLDLWNDGNAYWLIGRNERTGAPMNLWFVPHYSIEPISDKPDVFIDYYRYTPGGRSIDLDPKDVIHLRYGLDPRNPRKGLGPLRTALREIFSDEEASNFTATVLVNQGFPGVIISPDSDVPIPPNDVQMMKTYFKNEFTKDKRGEPFVTGAKTKVETLQWDLGKVGLSAIRNIAEERVTALLGIPAAVVGFGTGLQQTKVGAVMGEMRKLAYENAIIPTQKMMLPEINKKLVSEIDTRPEVEAAFDLRDVRVLQEDETDKIERIDKAVVGGWLPVDVGQDLAGYPVDETQHVYLRRMAGIEVQAGSKRMAESGGRSYKGRELDLEFYQYLNSMREREEGVFAKQLERSFRSFANAVADEYIRQANEVGLAKAGAETKDVFEYTVIIDSVVQSVMMEKTRDEVLAYVPHYLMITEKTFGGVNEFLGLGVNLTDEVEMEMIDVARDRTHLVDLSGQTKRAVNKAIREGRENGEGITGISDRIRSDVGAGPWRDAETRSFVIARTETKYAQNAATIKAGAQAGAEKYRVVDAQIYMPDGRPHTDSCGIVCEEIDGQVVSASDVDYLNSCEHPNGTRSFVPIFTDDEPVVVRPKRRGNIINLDKQGYE